MLLRLQHIAIMSTCS